MRNEAQEEAFTEWVNSFLKRHFPNHYKIAKENTSTWFVVRCAFEAGLDTMAKEVQYSLRLANVSQSPPPKEKE